MVISPTFLRQSREEAKGLDEDEIVEIIDRGKRIEWQRDVLTANIDPYGMTLDEYCKYLEKLEVKHCLDKALRASQKGREEKEKKKSGSAKRGKSGGSSSKDYDRKKPCKHCGKTHVAPDDECWTLDKNQSKRPRRDKYLRGGRGSNEHAFSSKEMFEMLNAVMKSNKKCKSRKVLFNGKQFSMDSRNNNSSDSDSSSYYQHSVEYCNTNYELSYDF